MFGTRISNARLVVAGTVDVLFTHSWHLWNDPKQAERRQPYPPLGTLYAAALARESGFAVAVFDQGIARIGPAKL